MSIYYSTLSIIIIVYQLPNEIVVLCLEKKGKRKHQHPFVEVSRGQSTPANCRRAIKKLVVPRFIEVKVLDGGLTLSTNASSSHRIGRLEDPELPELGVKSREKHLGA